ncbi:unnamed protein product [Ectocarpus sp. 8 AP-2014]
MVHPNGEGMVMIRDGIDSGGGPLLSEIGKQPQLQRRISKISSGSSTTSDMDSHSLLSGHDSLGSMLSDSGSVSSSGGGAARGSFTSVDAEGSSSSSGTNKRPLSDEEELRLVEQEQSNGQQLRKACDLCTKRKRKCNGKHPCSQCIETGAPNQCVYSPRLKSGRKKKVRIDGVLYEEGTYGGELALANPGGVRHNVDPSAGRFSASGAVGLAGHVENFFLATYLRDFNRLVPLTTESSVTEGMLEVLSPAVSSRGLATANPIKQPESRRQAKLAVFWGVVAMGSRILGAADESTVRYLGLMRSALRECFDCNDKEVVQAYLLLSTVETMRGNEAAGKRYLDHAHTMHNGNAIGPEGKLLRDRSEQDVSLDLVFQMYDQPDGAVSGFNRSAAVGDWRRNQHAADGSSSSPEQAHSGGGSDSGKPTSAVDQMIAQAVSPPSECQSSPLKALKYLSTVCGLSSEVFDPTNKCVTVKQYLAEMDSALKGAHSLFVATDLSECITGVVIVKIFGGVTVLMRSWGQLEDRDIGLAQLEEGVGYALTRPGLFTFPMWWHALHCAAICLAHFGRNDTYMRLRATFNKTTFPGTEMPSIEDYSPASVCPQLGGNCSKLAYWLQVRGTMCAELEWKPQFSRSRLSEASENAAYAAALERGYSCGKQKKSSEAAGWGEGCGAAEAPKQPVPNPVDQVSASDIADGGGQLRAALDAGLAEMGAPFNDFGGLGILEGSGAELDLDLGLGSEFDLSQLESPEQVVEASGEAEASLSAASAAGSRTVSATDVPAAGSGGGPPPPPPPGAGGAAAINSMQIPAGLVAGRSGSSSVAGSRGAGAGAPVFIGGGEISRGPSFGISGPAAVSSILGPAGASSGGALSRQSSLDINTIMQMVTSDEELKNNEGGTPDAIDHALEYGEGPAKEMFGIDLSMTE